MGFFVCFFQSPVSSSELLGYKRHSILFIILVTCLDHVNVTVRKPLLAWSYQRDTQYKQIIEDTLFYQQAPLLFFRSKYFLLAEELLFPDSRHVHLVGAASYSILSSEAT